MNTRTPRRGWRRITAAIAVALALALGPVVVAAPAQALGGIVPPSSLSCNSNRTVSAVVPRAWASAGPEVALWRSTVQRWDPYAQVWRNVSVVDSYATVNNQGFAVVPWSYQTNNRVAFRVGQAGWYRVYAAVVGGNGGSTWAGFISGIHCWVP